MSRPDNTTRNHQPQTKPIAMSIVVNLPDELERTIAAEAAKAGMTVSDYVADRLAKATAVTATGETKVRLTGAALVQRWRDLGLIGYRSDITDPEAHSRRLREKDSLRTREHLAVAQRGCFAVAGVRLPDADLFRVSAGARRSGSVFTRSDVRRDGCACS